MNARHQKFRLNVELRQFEYSAEKHFTLGSLGFAEVDCENIDLTYVRINSDELCANIDEHVCAFYSDVAESLTSHPPTPASSPSSPPINRFGEPSSSSTQVMLGLEFLQKKKRQWPFSEELASWEVWNLGLEICRTSNDELSVMRESVAEALGDLVLAVCSQINRPQYMPKMPSKTELTSVFDVQFSDCQPYLYKVVTSTPLNRRLQASQRPLATIQSVIKNLAYPT
ncbi:unnamed protein product, partial [Mesorhabditis spiculigera]